MQKKRVRPYNPKEYQKNKEKYLERQKKYRNNPKRREEYLRKARENSRKWYRANKERRYEMNRKHWKSKVKEMEEIIGRPRPKHCEVCGETGRICFDHCHKTGKARGWLCMKCNTILGKVNDDIGKLKALIQYLERANK